MRYIIAKVKKDTTLSNMFGGFMGGDNSKLDFVTDQIFDTEDDAKDFIENKKGQLESDCDESWNKMVDSEQKINNKLFDDGYVYMVDKYIILPVSSVVEITAVPKHRRK